MDKNADRRDRWTTKPISLFDLFLFVLPSRFAMIPAFVRRSKEFGMARNSSSFFSRYTLLSLGRLAGLKLLVLTLTVFHIQILLSLSALAQIEEMTALTEEGTAKAESAPEASKAIVQNVTQAVARRSMLEMIGEKSYQKNKSLIENRIIRESFKFIPFVTPGTPVKSSDGWKMSVQLKVSLSSLREMVLANGLLFDVEGPAAILPLVALSDRINQRQWRWWLLEKEDDGRKFLLQVQDRFNQAMYNEMNLKGFYLIRPQTTALVGVLPESFRSERLRPEDLRFWGEFFNAQMALKGDLRLRQSSAISGGYQISIKLQAVQTANSRSVAEVARTYETEPGTFEAVVRSKLATALPEVAKDLTTQIVDAWQKGTLGSNLLRLSVRGHLDPKQVNEFRNAVLKSMREIKMMRERVIEANGITFEVDYTGGAQDFGERFRHLSIPGFTMRVSDATDAGVVVDVKK